MLGNRLTGLDGLRGCAALCVFAFHADMIHTGYQHGQAYLAVDFFFLLSGFVMARAYERKFSEGLGCAAFMLARFRRLGPVMAVGGLIGLPLLATKLGREFFWVGALNLLMIPTPMGNATFPLNEPAWSVFFELVANVVHALVLCRLPTRSLAVWTAVMTGLLIWGTYGVTLSVGAHPHTFWLGVPGALAPYSLGILLWRWWGATPPVRVSASFTFAAMPVLFLATGLLGVHSWAFEMLFVFAICPLLLAGGLNFNRASPLATVAGALSFPLYAIHAPMLELTSHFGYGVLPGIVLSLLIAALLAYGPQTLRQQGLLTA